MDPNNLGDYTPTPPANEGPASQSAVDNSQPLTASETGTNFGRPPNVKPRKLGRAFGQFLGQHKKGGLIGASLLGAIALALVGFVLLLPFKAIHFLKIIEGKAYTRMEDTVNKRTEKLMDKYIQKKLDNGTLYNNHTNPVVTGIGPTALYQIWSENKFEKDLQDKYGIAFQRTANRRYNVLQNGQVLEIPTENGTLALENLTNAQFRDVLKNSTEQETKWFQIIKRRNLRAALYNKYGVKKWWFFEKPAQKVQDVRTAIKRKIQNTLNDRIVRPVSGKLADYFNCLINDSCGSINDNSQVEQALADEVTGAADAAVDRQATNATVDATEQQAQAAAADSAASSVAVVTIGYKAFYYAHVIDNDLKNGGKLEQVLKARSYLGYASFFAANATAIDQIVAGEAVNGPSIGPGANPSNAGVTAAQTISYNDFFQNLKSFTAAANPLSTGYTNVDAFNEQIGNPAASRVYEKYYAGEDISKLKDNKKCQGQALPSSQTVCPDQKTVPPTLAEIRNLPLYGIIEAMSTVYDQACHNDPDPVVKAACFGAQQFTTLGGNIVNWILQHTGIQALIDALLRASGISGAIDDGVKKAMGAVFGPGVKSLATNGDWFDNMQAGADVTANQTMQNQLGGELLSPQQQQAWATQIQNEEIAKEGGWHGVAYKVASINSPTSLIGRLISWAPSSANQVPPKVASFITGVFSPNSLLNGFITVGNALTPGSHMAFADVPQYQDPFGVDQIGYPVNDPHLTQDPEVTARQCEPGSVSRQQIDQAYQAAVTAYEQDPQGHPLNVTDWCMLEDQTINANKSYFTKDDDGGLATAVNGTAAQGEFVGAAQCQGGAAGAIGNAKIACEAATLLGIPYANGSDGIPGAYYGHAPQQWYQQHIAGNAQYNRIDCSGLTSVAVWLAFGNQNPSLNRDYCSATYLHDSNFRQINLSDIKPGDLVVRGTSCGNAGHVAVVETVNQPGNSMTVAEAYTHGKPSTIRPHPINGKDFDHAVRYIGPGSDGS